MTGYSLTQTLLDQYKRDYQHATESEFLRLAANGQLSKALLGKWLANDRLYIHSYIRGIGLLLSFLEYPQAVAGPEEPTDASVKLLEWLTAALVNIRREEKFFVETASRYGIDVNVAPLVDGKVLDKDKLKGLVWFEALFGSVLPGSGPLPWLEGAVLYWATEKCYLDAWSWAKAQLSVQADPSQDLDGGALRTKFIDNWTGPEFVDFVNDLGKIIDDAVVKEVEKRGEDVQEELFGRAEKMWREVLVAEEVFWPECYSSPDSSP